MCSKNLHAGDTDGVRVSSHTQGAREPRQADRALFSNGFRALQAGKPHSVGPPCPVRRGLPRRTSGIRPRTVHVLSRRLPWRRVWFGYGVRGPRSGDWRAAKLWIDRVRCQFARGERCAARSCAVPHMFDWPGSSGQATSGSATPAQGRFRSAVPANGCKSGNPSRRHQYCRWVSPGR
jgi:hypothetical protein